MSSFYLRGAGYQMPHLKSFKNETTTVSYGLSLIWNTSTVYDATNVPAMAFGIGAVMATTTAAGVFPAGVVWGYATSAGGTDTNIPADGIGLSVVSGVHPYAFVYGSATYGNNMWTSGLPSGCMYASNTTIVMLDSTLVGNCLETGATDSVHQLPIWVRIGGGF